MRISYVSLSRWMPLFFCCLFLSGEAWAQSPPSPSRIVERVNESDLVTLRGNTHPLAQPQFDRGAAPPDLPMGRMLLVLKRSDAQEAALETLLEAQQDRNSPSYHQWLTPDEFGAQFGPSDQDIQTVASWLQSHGFQLAPMSRGRATLEFSGTAAQVLDAFHTEIHKYTVNGQDHWANAGDPQIPRALAPVITGVNSLHNFLKTPEYRVAGIYTKSRATGKVKALQPNFTFFDNNICAGTGDCYFLGPYDFATIYNVLPLWNASSPIDGTGQNIAIIGRSDIVLQDVADFRNLFGMAPNVPNIIHDGNDPGLVSGDETEAVLDVEWSGAVAKGATINLVVSASTESTDGVDLPAIYAIENNIAPVISESFGQCELFLGTAGNSFENGLREQAAAQGITFLTATGDQGAAACDPATEAPDPATHGLMVSGLASSPYGIAVGGTDFLNFGPNFTVASLNTPSPYWSAANNPTTEASALGYVPESTWNSTCTNRVYIVIGLATTPEGSCNNAELDSEAPGLVIAEGGGGGKSNCNTTNGSPPFGCAGGYAKPSWQSAPGVPADGARDIPDVSLFASPGFMNSGYILCEADQTESQGTCSLNDYEYSFLAVGGTSASTPAFAGIMAMVNQSTQSAGQGNANHVLYKLASSSVQTGANCNSSNIPAGGCIFNDVTSGTIAMPCAAGSPDCTVSLGSDAYGVLSGYNAGAGYDLATGLGSVNAYNLVRDWPSPGISTSTTLYLNSGKAVNITHGQVVSLDVAVTPSAATGNVSLMGSPSGNGSIPMGGFFTLQGGAVSGTTTALAGGTSYQVKAHYAGDNTYAPSDSAPVTVTVAPEPSTTLITIPVFSSATGAETGNTPATVVYGTPVIARMDVGNAKAAVTFPMQPVCATPACPTGSVTLSDSVSGGPSGVFPLNSEGYAEDLAAQFSGGAHQLTAAYPGDNSYSSSTEIYNLTVTPAPMEIFAPTIPVNPPLVGTPINMFTTVEAISVYPGAVPTGTVTFYDGTTLLPGTVTYGNGGSGAAGTPAKLGAFLTVTFTTSGTHQISARYSGDANYGPASSPPTAAPLVYATTAAVSANPSTVIYGQSTSVTLTATISTGQPASNAALKPTGMISFSVNGTATTTTGQDANGNWILQATLATSPQQNEGITADYSGDSNYAPSSQSTYIVVTIPDFAVSVSSTPLVITAGQTGTAVVTIAPMTSYTSTVALSCYGAVPAGTACVFSPATITLTNGAPATSNLSLAVPAPSTTLKATARPGARRIGPPADTTRHLWWAASAASLIASLLLILLPSRRRSPGFVLGLFLVATITFGIGCGTGGSGSGGGGGGPIGGGDGGGAPGVVATTTTLTSTSAKIAPGASTTLTATINSSKTFTGYVNFNDASFPYVIAPNVNVVDGTAQAQMINTGSLSADPGTHAITAAYSGDVSNEPSQSGTLNIVVTGPIAVLVVGQTSVDTHTAYLNVTIQ